MFMAMVARIIGVSLLTSGGGALIAFVLFGNASSSEAIGLALILACVGGIIGAIAGAAREIVTAAHQKPYF
jgi:hypothetical protein